MSRENSFKLQRDKNFSVNQLVKLSLFSAIVFILGMTPLGFIPMGTLKVVTVHIPVIIGSIMLGYKSGCFLGFVFGLTSLISAHIQPNLTSYFFSPIVSGNLLSLVVCFVPRMLVGIVPYFVFKLLRKFTNTSISLVISGMSGAFTNSLFVMGFIYIFFAEEYAGVLNTTLDSLLIVIIANVSLNAIVEMIASAILNLSICKVLFRVQRKEV